MHIPRILRRICEIHRIRIFRIFSYLLQLGLGLTITLTLNAFSTFSTYSTYAVRVRDRVNPPPKCVFHVF